MQATIEQPVLVKDGVKIFRGIEFTEDFKIPNSIHTRIHFSAESFNKWVFSIFPELKGKESVENRHRPSGDPNMQSVGTKSFYMTTLAPTCVEYSGGFGFLNIGGKPYTKQSSLELAQGSKLYKVSFDGDVQIPVLSEVHSIGEEPRVWMSLTPWEVASQRLGIRRSVGRVLMCGCGLGWQALRVLERAKVTHLTIVDKDKDVLDYFGGRLKTKFGDRVTLIHGDAYDEGSIEKVRGRYDSCLWDIWPCYGSAYNDDKFQKIAYTLVDENVKMWGWGDVEETPSSGDSRGSSFFGI